MAYFGIFMELERKDTASGECGSTVVAFCSAWNRMESACIIYTVT